MQEKQLKTSSTQVYPGLETMRGYTLRATDGHIGHIHHWYFDDRIWTVRYLVVETGGWLSGRGVLISPGVCGDPDPESRSIQVRLTREQVRTSPEWDQVMPISRRYEIDMQRHYGWPPYWPGFPLPAPPLIPPPEIEAEAHSGEARVESGVDPNLNSIHDLTRYRILGRDDAELGHAKDFIAQREYWIVRYLVVDTGKWLPGRKVLLLTSTIDRFDWVEATLHAGVSRERVRSSPPCDPHAPIERDYELLLHAHYEVRPYWE